MREIGTNHERAPTNTWRRQPKTTKRPFGCSLLETPARGSKTTSRIRIGKSEIPRVCAKKARNTWTGGGVGRQRQRASVRLEIFLRMKRRYSEKPSLYAGTEVEYAIKRMGGWKSMHKQHYATSRIRIEYRPKYRNGPNWGGRW